MTSLLKITNWTPEYFIENRSKCNSILENLEALKEIPLLNINTLQTIKHRQLVKFKGMIQDMHDPECYLRQYEVKNTQTKTCELKCGMYTDSAECLPDEMVLLESENNQSSERGTYTVISIPGLNDWTKETYGQSHLGMKVINNLKRNLDESNSEIINNFESDRKKEKIVVIRDDKEINTMTYDTSHQCSFSKEYILNFPIPMDDGRKCIVKIYEDISLKLNQVIEIIGFISLDPFLNGVHYSDEFMTQSEIIVHHPSPSLVPRLHAIKIIQPTKQDIKINSQIMSKAELVRSDLHLILNQLLFGDHLAADYLICHLLSSIYVRRDYFCLGSYPLNITHFPVIKYKEFPKDLYKFLTLLTEKSHLLEITLENLNNLTLLPKKDYECNRLTSGVLQLSNNTHLVIDETGLTTGKMTQIGRENYNAICDLVNFQKVAYDFTYYKMEYETDIPVLILSEAKSFIPCQTQVVLQVDSESKNVYPQIMEIAEQYLKDENRVINIRQYLEIMRDTEFEFNDEELIKEIQGDIVRWRQLNKNVDQLQSLMVLARLLSLSYGSNVLTIEYWKKALQMETERLSRLPDKKEI